MSIPSIDFKRVDALIDLALFEDLGQAGDVTSEAVIPRETIVDGVFRCKEEGMIVAGLPVAAKVFEAVDPTVDFTILKQEGEKVGKGERIAEVRGSARSILTAERTALNFLQRLCGVATTARKYADALKGSKTVILDTRKTTPGYRNLEKYAVAVGGAQNHRFGLYDRIMIKDNHRELAAREGSDSITRSVARARAFAPHLEIEVETDSLDEVREAAATGAEYILLDNMDDATVAEAVKIIAGRAKSEASGNITLERLPALAKTGVDFVSSGALTHSVKSADISLDVLRPEEE
ncbi:MAG: carboxylating nicotinate-nucleotide diphosphorylase [Victivallaceae bacterium]|nr:carboxylating nicotinate-nucleotide diphosphorylase [Victivallaceae bacterium]